MSTMFRGLIGTCIKFIFNRVPYLVPLLLMFHLGNDALAQAPLLPVQHSTAKLPMLGEAIRDPKVLRNEVRDDLQASAIQREIAELSSDLKRGRGERLREIHSLLMANYASLVAYYEDVLNGTLPKEGNSASSGDLSRARRQLIQHAAAVAKHSKSKQTVAQARYHYHTQKYVLNSDRARAINVLKSLRHLDGYLKRRADLVVALHKLDHGNAAAQDQAKNELVRLIRPLHLEGAIVARLALARKYAGLNSRGRKYLRTDNKYRSYLYHATQRAGRLPEAQKQAVLSYAVGVWRAAEGSKASWAKPPLNLAAYADTNQVNGIRERQAIALWRSRNYNRAAAIYSDLSSKHQDSPIGVRLDLRILQIRQSEYARTNNSRNYEIALQNMLGKSRNNPELLRDINQRYARLVQQEIKAAKSPRATRPKRTSVISLITRYLDQLDNEAQRIPYIESTGDLYALNAEHEKAVGVYLDLVMNSGAGNKDTLYGKAVSSQSALAHWPAQAPWFGVKRGFGAERNKLLTIYQGQFELHKKANPPRWDIIAHLGLLDVTLGQSQVAFARWEKHMTETPSNHPDAQQAAGFMLEVHNQTKNWAGQERLVRLAIKTGLQPRRGKAGFNLPELLAQSLLNGGRELLEAGKAKQAREKLSEFVAKFSSHRQHDEGQFYLAHAYKGEGNHKQSVATLVDLTKDHPASSYMQRALILGGDWGIAMALEEEPIYFHQMYVVKFARSAETPRIRDGLITLYEGRELIGEATDLLYDQARDSRLSPERRLAAAVKMLELEEHYGGDEKALKASELILALGQGDPGAQAAALAYQVRHFNEQGDLNKMQQLESRINALGIMQESAQALAEARFYIAKFVAQVKRDEIQSVALRDPLATLNDEYNYYLRTKRLYDRVCAAGESGHCAPAMMEISSVASEMQRRISDIHMAEDFAQQTVDEFNARKHAILTTIENHHNSYLAKANATVAQGNTNPTYTEQILWENSNDWNFDRITGEIGNGYIQFSPNLVIGE